MVGTPMVAAAADLMKVRRLFFVFMLGFISAVSLAYKHFA